MDVEQIKKLNKMVTEFGLQKMYSNFDMYHKYLNDIGELSNPTTEHIAAWIWRKLKPQLTGLTGVTVSEGPNYSCTYRGD